MKGKARERAALGAAGQDTELAKEGVYTNEDDLFSLSSLRSKKALDKVADTQAPHADELEARAAVDALLCELCTIGVAVASVGDVWGVSGVERIWPDTFSARASG